MAAESGIINSTERPSAELNLTPMIDVVFQLLIYFLLGTSFVVGEQAYHMDLPPRQGMNTVDPLELDDDPMVVEVRHRPGNTPAIFVSGPWSSPRDVRQLRTFLEERHLDRGGLFPSDHPIRIAPQAGATWGDAVEAFNAAVGAGFQQVGFQPGATP